MLSISKPTNSSRLSCHSLITSLFFSYFSLFLISDRNNFFDNCAKAQIAATLTMLELSSKSLIVLCISDLSDEFPIAINTFLINLFLPILFTGDPENNDLKSTSDKSDNSFRVGFFKSSLGRNEIVLDILANLFQGHIAKQSSQPYILLPINLRSFLGI